MTTARFVVAFIMMGCGAIITSIGLVWSLVENWRRES